jgi:putative FmdB family regulatory protein
MGKLTQFKERSSSSTFSLTTASPSCDWAKQVDDVGSTIRQNANLSVHWARHRALSMPIYEYRPLQDSSCSYCMHGFELLQKLVDAPLETCPQCRQSVHRVISAPNLGKTGVSLERNNLEKHGFTRYEKAEKGVYEKTAGCGPDILKDS